MPGYITDVNGTRLTMFGPEQVVQVKYASNDGFPASGRWQEELKTDFSPSTFRQHTMIRR